MSILKSVTLKANSTEEGKQEGSGLFLRENFMPLLTEKWEVAIASITMKHFKNNDKTAQRKNDYAGIYIDLCEDFFINSRGRSESGYLCMEVVSIDYGYTTMHDVTRTIPFYPLKFYELNNNGPNFKVWLADVDADRIPKHFPKTEFIFHLIFRRIYP